MHARLGAAECYLPGARTDTDNPADTVAYTDDTHDADGAADCTVALAAADTAAGTAAPDAPGAAAAAADDDADDDGTRHDCNHPYHDGFTFTVRGLVRILDGKGL